MPTIQEGRYTLDFEDSAWRVLKYDEAGGFYKTVVAKISETKAVDVVGIITDGSEQSLLLLEISDYSSDVKKLDDLSQNGVLADEFAQKVRDTLAGIVLGCRTEGGEFFQDFGRLMVRPNVDVRVLFWLCRCPIAKPRMTAFASNLNQALKKKLRFVSRQPFVVVDIADAGLPKVALRVT